MAGARIASAFKKVKYELPVFCVMLALAVPQITDFSSQAYSTLLALDYRVGFAPRIFMGSLLSLFTDFRGRREINIFYVVMFLLTFLLVAWLAGRLIRSAEAEMKNTMIALVALFLALPYTAAFLYPQIFSPDRFLIFFTLLGLLVFDKPYLRWSLPLFLGAALATHHMFLFAFMPAFAVLFAFMLGQKIPKQKDIAFCAFNCTVTALLSGYFYLFGGLKGISLEQLYDFAQAHTDLPIDRSADSIFKGYFFLDPSLVFQYNTKLGPGISNILNYEWTTAVFLLPLIIMFFVIWKRAIKNSVRRYDRFVFLLCLLAPLARLPLFFVTSEIYRGRIGIVMVQFFLLFYFLHHKNPAVLSAVRSVAALFKSNAVPVLLLVAYYAAAFSTYAFAQPWVEMMNRLFA